MTPEQKELLECIVRDYIKLSMFEMALAPSGSTIEDRISEANEVSDGLIRRLQLSGFLAEYVDETEDEE